MTWQTWLVLSIAGLMTLGSVGLVIWVLRFCKDIIETFRPVMLEQLRLVDKATSIAAAQDLAAYQGIQVMDQRVVGYDGESYDPSDEAEFKREAERNHQDPEVLSAEDNEALVGLF